MDWLLAPIDASRTHEVGLAISWHARLMVLAWGIMAPVSIIVARFFKVWPGQNWPAEVDNRNWWRTHWIGQSLVAGLSVIAFALVLPLDWDGMSLHNRLGYLVLICLGIEVALGAFRGSKGGPNPLTPDAVLRGHHYDMTRWRRLFELLHKSIGYGVLLLATGAILLGLWKANAPVWIWGSLILWWCFLAGMFMALQRRGRAVDTYQAIWGPDMIHPGNQRRNPGWGVRRHSDQPRDRVIVPQDDTEKETTDVRSTRGDGF